LPDAAEMDKAAGKKIRKNVPRNVRLKQTVASAREGLAPGDTEPLKPEQRLMQCHNTSTSASHHLGSESTSLASSNTGSSGPRVKETPSKNTDSAVVTNVDSETKLAHSNSPVSSANCEDASLDLDEQSILTYVFQ